MNDPLLVDGAAGSVQAMATTSGAGSKHGTEPTDPSAKPATVTACGTSERKVPGSSASTVEVNTLWNSMTRWILSSKCGDLQSFLRDSLQKQTGGSEVSHTSRPVWPMPLPYRKVDDVGLSTSFGAGEQSLQRAINAAVLVLNWLHLGQPKKWPGDARCSSMTMEQKAVVLRLRRLCSGWQSAAPVSAEDMGRAAGKIECLEEEVAFLTRAAIRQSCLVGSGKKPVAEVAPSNVWPVKESQKLGEVQLAKDIESHRLQFSGSPSFDPSPLLDEETQCAYIDPLTYSIPPCDSLEDPPHVQVRGQRSEVLKLFQSLDRSGRLAIFTPDQVRMQHRAGLFALMKNLTTDRLILDSRPANTLEAPLCRWTQTMGAVPPLLDIVLGKGQTLIAAGEDLKDFYYFFQVTSSRAARNAISCNLTRAEAMQFSSFPASADSSCNIFIPALCTMAMGDVNAVEYGQESHAKLALQTGLRIADMVSLRNRFPRGDWAVGLVIDDFICIEKVCDPLVDSPLSSQIADTMVAKYLEVGLVPNAKKRFRAETKPEFWGISIDGEQGIIQAQVQRTLPIAMITARVAKLGWASRKLLEVLTGSWTAILQCRRRCMCLMFDVFQAIQDHPYDTTFELPGNVVAELWTLVVLAPFFVTDLRAEVMPKLTLVDASDDWKAEVSSDLPATFAEELGRHRLTKASWSRLLSPYRAWLRSHQNLDPELEVPDGESPLAVHPLWDKLAKTLPFRTERRDKVRRRTHINISELEAYLEAEMRLGRQHPNARHLIGSDSQVTLGAVIKGRSSSRALNNRLRKFLCTTLSYNTYSYAQYIHTSSNVADDPTRDRPCRIPSEVIPDWLQSAFQGDFVGLDNFLEHSGVSLSSMARLPQEPLVQHGALCRTSERLLRRLEYIKAKSVRTGSKGRRREPPAAVFRRVPWLPRIELEPALVDELKKFPEAQFVLPPGATLEDVIHLQGHLDLFSGSRVAARAQAKATGRWVLTFDLKHSPDENLLDEGLQQKLESLCERGAFASLGAGPVCASFSRAVRPAVRTKQQPEGLRGISANMAAKVLTGNAMSSWLCRLLRICLGRKMAFWVENPALSFLWDQPCWRSVIEDYNLGFFTTDYCRWGTPWRKRTRFLMSGELSGKKLLCNCCRRHVVLRGYSRSHKMSMTKLAEPYPTGIGRLLATAMLQCLLPPARRTSLDPAACARCCSRRIGEASNPGPRRRNEANPTVQLDDVPMVGQTTLLIQKRVWALFHSWMERQLSAELLETVCNNPQLQVVLLRSFGNWLYNKGEPMYLFRHLVVLCQQRFPSERHLVSESWTLLRKWEVIQPATHRPPLPKVVLDAMLAIALSWGWLRWSAITALSFHGAMRVGEPINARRSDLLLAEDAGIELPVVFLQVGAPKPGRRGKGKVQHSRITDELTVKLVEAVLGPLEPQAFLYPASPSSYRRRWDLVLKTLQIKASAALTPGSLRGGGAVFLYQNNLAISDILWMRLRHLCTLEHYLQETGAANVLAGFQKSTRTLVKNCASTYPFIQRLRLSESSS